MHRRLGALAEPFEAAAGHGVARRHHGGTLNRRRLPMSLSPITDALDALRAGGIVLIVGGTALLHLKSSSAQKGPA